MKLYSVDEAAAILNIHRDTLRIWIYSNKVPVYRMRRTLRIDVDEVKELMRNRPPGKGPRAFHNEKLAAEAEARKTRERIEALRQKRAAAEQGESPEPADSPDQDS